MDALEVRRVKVLCLAAASALFFCPSRAWPEAGLTAAQILTRPYSAQAIAMGGAFAAMDSGLDSLEYNPAGLATLKKTDIETAYSNGVFGDNFGFFGVAQPVFDRAVVSAGYLYDNAGTIDLNESNGQQGNVTAEEDMVGLVGLSVPLPGGLSVGGIGKYMHLDLAQQATATSWAADAGALWHTPLAGLNLGAAIQNMGPNVKFEQAGDPLPQTERFGAAYELPQEQAGTIASMFNFIKDYDFTMDVIQTRDLPLYESVGVQIESEMVDLRAGYTFNDPSQNVSFGFGVKEMGFRADFAMNVLSQNLGDVYNVSLGFQF